jgi:hypothetical protein
MCRCRERLGVGLTADSKHTNGSSQDHQRGLQAHVSAACEVIEQPGVNRKAQCNTDRSPRGREGRGTYHEAKMAAQEDDSEPHELRMVFGLRVESGVRR